jgi:hypothetical protein
MECKRHLQTRSVELLRCGHYHPTVLRAQLLRWKRWLAAWKTELV